MPDDQDLTTFHAQIRREVKETTARNLVCRDGLVAHMTRSRALIAEAHELMARADAILAEHGPRRSTR